MLASWINSINNGMTIASTWGLFLLLPSIAINLLLNDGKFNLKRYGVNVLFFIYMCCLFSLVFLPLPTIDNLPSSYKLQLIPGYSLYDLVKDPSLRVLAPIVLNIVMTIPFGAYLAYYWKMNLKLVTALSFVLTLFIELGQLTGLFFIYQGSYRLCDVDDLICNTLGGVIGLLLVKKCTFLPELEENKDKHMRIAFSHMLAHGFIIR